MPVKKEIKTIKKSFSKILKSKKRIKKFLISAGIIDKTGSLTENYK